MGGGEGAGSKEEVHPGPGPICHECHVAEVGKEGGLEATTKDIFWARARVKGVEKVVEDWEGERRRKPVWTCRWEVSRERSGTSGRGSS